MTATLVVCLIALCLAVVVILVAFLLKGDVSAALRLPFLRFSIEARDRGRHRGR